MLDRLFEIASAQLAVESELPRHHREPDELRREGRLLIGHAPFRDSRAIRLVCVNPDLEERHIDHALGEIRRAARGLSPADEPALSATH